jgi:hypothetical protein
VARFCYLPALAAALAVLAAVTAGAQEDLDPLRRLPFDARSVTDVETTSFQVYRIPMSATVRDLEDEPWGLRVTFPVSLGGYEVSAATSVGDLAERLSTVTVVPGVEFLLPAGSSWTIKPFAEAGLTAASDVDDDTDVLYGAGVRTRGEYRPGQSVVTLGGALEYRGSSDPDSLIKQYSTLAAAADVQWPLGFSLGGRPARGGLFVAVRNFSDVKLRDLDSVPFEVSTSYEAGLSFATEPPLRVWKLPLPWLGLAWRQSDAVSGLRLYLAFPF